MYTIIWQNKGRCKRSRFGVTRRGRTAFPSTHNLRGFPRENFHSLVGVFPWSLVSERKGANQSRIDLISSHLLSPIGRIPTQIDVAQLRLSVDKQTSDQFHSEELPAWSRSFPQK